MSVNVTLTIGGLLHSGNTWTFRYKPESYVESVSKVSTIMERDSVITIKGSKFEPLQTFCRFGLQVTPATLISDREILCKAPQQYQAGPVELALSTNGGYDWTEIKGITIDYYSSGQLFNPSPRFGPASGGTPLTMEFLPSSGYSFNDSYICRFGDASTMDMLEVPGHLDEAGWVQCITPNFQEGLTIVEVQNQNVPGFTRSGVR